MTIDPNSRRAQAAPIIAKVIDEVGREDMKALRAALRDAYPYGQRKYWPYKVWCDEVRRQVYGNRIPKRHDGLSPRVDATLELFE